VQRPSNTLPPNKFHVRISAASEKYHLEHARRKCEQTAQDEKYQNAAMRSEPMCLLKKASSDDSDLLLKVL
jgi:hypothetical protein